MEKLKRETIFRPQGEYEFPLLCIIFGAASWIGGWIIHYSEFPECDLLLWGAALVIWLIAFEILAKWAIDNLVGGREVLCGGSLIRRSGWWPRYRVVSFEAIQNDWDEGRLKSKELKDTVRQRDAAWRERNALVTGIRAVRQRMGTDKGYAVRTIATVREELGFILEHHDVAFCEPSSVPLETTWMELLETERKRRKEASTARYAGQS